MHLAELLRLGARPGAGLLLSLTRRCPLSCAHCSTSSGPGVGPDPEAEVFLRLVRSFTPESRPEVILLSGGEPLLRPRLVAELSAAARRVGTATALLSGMFFARGGRVPGAIAEAVAGLDHFGASIDPYHEPEVPRADALAALAAIRGLVPHVSVHVAAPRAAADAIASEVRTRFADTVPLLLSPVQPTGRAAQLGTAAPAPGPGEEDEHATAVQRGAGCAFAGWPLVGGDGTVHACTRESLVREAGTSGGAAHLTLGHTTRDGWAALRDRSLEDPVLRAVRAFGPDLAAREFGGAAGADPCRTCLGLSSGDTPARAHRYLNSTAGRAVEQLALDLASARSPRRIAALRGARADRGFLVELGEGQAE